MCMQASAEADVRDLIVVLEKVDETAGRQIEGEAAAAALLPRVPLALVERAEARQGRELGSVAEIVSEIGVAPAGGGDKRGMMPVLAPERVEAVRERAVRLQEPRVLRFALSN